jgi:hypothetical protein
MCCLFTTLVFLGPRVGIVIWALLEPARWQAAFDSFVWPLLGFIFVPWMTLSYALVAVGGIEGGDWSRSAHCVVSKAISDQGIEAGRKATTSSASAVDRGLPPTIRASRARTMTAASRRA